MKNASRVLSRFHKICTTLRVKRFFHSSIFIRFMGFFHSLISYLPLSPPPLPFPSLPSFIALGLYGNSTNCPMALFTLQNYFFLISFPQTFILLYHFRSAEPILKVGKLLFCVGMSQMIHVSFLCSVQQDVNHDVFGTAACSYFNVEETCFFAIASHSRYSPSLYIPGCYSRYSLPLLTLAVCKMQFREQNAWSRGFKVN